MNTKDETSKRTRTIRGASTTTDVTTVNETNEDQTHGSTDRSGWHRGGLLLVSIAVYGGIIGLLLESTPKILGMFDAFAFLEAHIPVEERPHFIDRVVNLIVLPMSIVFLVAVYKMAFVDDKTLLPLINVNRLLRWQIDEYKTSIDGLGDKAQVLRDTILQDLNARKIANMTAQSVIGYTSLLSKATHPYLLVSAKRGVRATIAIYVNKMGERDLYVSWRLFIQGVLNYRLLVVMGLLALPFAGCAALFQFIAISLAVSLSIDTSGVSPILALFSAFPAFLAFYVIECLLVAGWGYLRKGDLWYHFWADPTIFHIEEIQALSYAVHSAVVGTLKAEGIKSDVIRQKTNFRASRRDRNNS